MIVTEFEERDLIRSVLTDFGAPEDEALIQADLLVAADLGGHPSHGLQRLPVLAGRLRTGLIRPESHGKSDWITDTVLRVDGERGFGPVVAIDAVRSISHRARSTGIAVAAIHNNNHIGMLGYYVEHLARGGQAGIALTTGEALVHPWEGLKPMLGANPIAIGIPTNDEPFVVDMATSLVSMGQVLEHLWRGEIIPDGWALDADGKPTRDPLAASHGSLSPFGGFKGYALGLAVGLIVSAMTGSAIGPDVHGTLDTSHVSNKGDVFICIDIARLADNEHVDHQLTAYLDLVRRSPAQPGVRTIAIPGERSRTLRAERRSNGIPMIDAVWQTCIALKKSGTND